MGLFSSKKKITVATTVSRVIEDKLLPNSAKSGLIKGLLRDEDQIVENILEDMSSNIAVKAERMYRYGRTKYIYGNPQSNMVHRAMGVSTVEDTIKGIEGLTAHHLVMDYNQYAPFNSLHFGWQTLVDSHGYDQTTNEITHLSAQKGHPVYLDDMYVVIPSSLIGELNTSSMAQWGASAKSGYTPLRPVQDAVGNIAAASLPQVNALATVESVVVRYIWIEPEVVTVNGVQVTRNAVRTGSMEFVVPEFSDSQEFFQAKYHFDQVVTTVWDDFTQTTKYTYRKVIRYFTYQEGKGDYPELDGVFRGGLSDLGSFFPFAYFRYNKTSQTDILTTPEYKSTKKLLKYLSMDYNAVGDAINANPDITDVEQAMLVMAVPKNPTAQIEIRYLFDFFYRVAFEYSGGSSGAIASNPVLNALPFLSNPATPGINIMIQDAKFKMKLSLSKISKKLIAGNVAAVGGYSWGTGTQPSQQMVSYFDNDGKQIEYLLENTEEYLYYRKQVTAGLYQEVRVSGLQMFYYVFEDYTATTDTVLIPLDYSITQHYSNPDREVLYARSLHYVFNSKIITKIKWYQQSWFKAVMIIVSIVIMVVSWGGSSGISASLIALTEMTLTELLIMVIVNVAIMVAVNLAMKLFVKLLGPEAALILALVLAAVGLVDALNSGSLAGAPFAKDLLQLSTGLIKTTGDFYTEQLMGIKSEYEALGMDIKEKTELLESANKLLHNDNILSPFVIFGESPTDYYNRTVHSGNIGTYSIDAIHSYVDNALKLPEIDQTIEGF